MPVVIIEDGEAPQGNLKNLFLLKSPQNEPTGFWVIVSVGWAGSKGNEQEFTWILKWPFRALRNPLPRLLSFSAPGTEKLSFRNELEIFPFPWLLDDLANLLSNGSPSTSLYLVWRTSLEDKKVERLEKRRRELAGIRDCFLIVSYSSGINKGKKGTGNFVPEGKFRLVFPTSCAKRERS